jgi:GT2 family glycosyltransferase
MGKGGIIIALDNDAVFANEYVVFQAANLFMKQERLGAVGFHILSVDGQFLDHASWGYPAALKHLSDSKFETTTFVGAGYAVRRDAWVDAGGYDSNLFFTWEEYDFCLRAIERGWNILYDGTLKILHKNSGEERVKWTAERASYFVRNRLMIARKWRVNWLCLLPRISGYIINGAVNGHLGATMEGIFQALHQDRQFHKKHMTPEMRRYIARNEQRHRGSWAARVHSEVLKARSFEVHTVAHAENVNRPRKQS